MAVRASASDQGSETFAAAFEPDKNLLYRDVLLRIEVRSNQKKKES